MLSLVVAGAIVTQDRDVSKDYTTAQKDALESINLTNYDTKDYTLEMNIVQR